MYLLGYDIGSSSVKASLVDAQTGKTVASDFYPRTEAEIIALRPGWAEQRPQQWWDCLKQATASVMATSGIDAKEIAAIGISYQMHGLVMVDKDLEPLRPAIIWCDSRGVPYGEKAFAGSYFYGNAFNYRIDDGMHIVTEPGFVSRYGALNSIRGEWQHYELKLYPKDYAEYTLRNVSENSYIDVVCRSNSLSSLFITENMRDENKVLYNGSLNSADENEYGVLHLPLEREADTAAIRITCTQGEVFLKKIIYR